MKLLSKLKFVLSGSILSFGAVAAINSNNVVQASAEGEGVTTVTDVITADKLPATSTRYKPFSNLVISADSKAKYSGTTNVPSKTSNIGFSSNSKGGFVSSTSGGILKSVTITFPVNASNRKLNVFASSLSFSSVSDLYDGDAKPFQSIDLTSTESKTETDSIYSYTLSLEDDSLRYVGFTSYTDAIQINSISIVWQPTVFGVLESIEITNSGRTNFDVGEVYSSEGLVAVMKDTEGNIETIPANEIKTDLDNHLFTEEDVPSIKNKVTYNGKTSEEFNIQVSSLPAFKKVTSEKEDWTGTYLIVGEKDGALCAADSSLNEFDVANSYKNVTVTEDLIKASIGLTFKISKFNTGYSIQKQNGDYIGNTTSGTGTMSVRSTPILNSVSFDADDGLTITSGTGDSETYLRFNNSSNQMRFRYYVKTETGKLTGSAVSLYEYQAPVSESLTIWANQINDTLTCDNGANAPSVETWNNIKSNYFDSKITGVDLETIRSETGNPNGTSLQKALAKYDYIISKYGDSLYSNYLDRNVSINLAQAVNRLSIPSSSLITLVSILSVGSCVGIFLIIKRRKGTNN